jgi:hypothetical protein
MAVSKLSASGEANEFNIGLTGVNVSVVLNKEYPSGGYTITSSSADNSMDIYIFNTDGSSAGYTGSKSLTATKPFNKIVVVGGTNGDLISFTFKETFTAATDNDEVTAGPFITSSTTTSLPGSADTSIITGGNFASDITATWTSAATASVYNPTIVRNSATQVTITRGNSGTLTPLHAPWILTLSNPGVNDPAGSAANKLSFTVGTLPTWTTTSPLPSYAKGVAFSQTLVATDTEGSTMTYTVASGTLPDGITLASNGVLSGTATVTTSHTPTIRATDTGGNTVDRTFTFNNVGANAPAWVTSAGNIATGTVGTAYSITFSATDDSGSAPTYSVASGTLPTGLTLNGTTGVLSGTPTTRGTFNFTLNATDANGTSTSRAFTAPMAGTVIVSITSTQQWTYPSSAITSAGVEALVVAGGGGGGDGNAAGGGGGAGALIYGSSTTLFTPGTEYTVTIGAGGVGARQDSIAASNGGNTSIGSLIVAIGGGRAGSNAGSSSAASGGSGGGASGPSAGSQTGASAGSVGTVPSGFTGFVNAGGNWLNTAFNWGSAGGGGGAGGAGGNGGAAGAGRTYSITGSAVTYAVGGIGAASNTIPGGPGGPGAANTGNGGDGANDPEEGQRRPGGSGIVVLKYLAP